MQCPISAIASAPQVFDILCYREECASHKERTGMFFDSTVYFVFLILVVSCYWQLRFDAQNWLLLASSYFFYGWWDSRFLLLMGASTCINYYVSHRFEVMEESSARRRLFIFALVLNFSFL